MSSTKKALNVESLFKQLAPSIVSFTRHSNGTYNHIAWEKSVLEFLEFYDGTRFVWASSNISQDLSRLKAAGYNADDPVQALLIKRHSSNVEMGIKIKQEARTPFTLKSTVQRTPTTPPSQQASTSTSSSSTAPVSKSSDERIFEAMTKNFGKEGGGITRIEQTLAQQAVFFDNGSKDTESEQSRHVRMIIWTAIVKSLLCLNQNTLLTAIVKGDIHTLLVRVEQLATETDSDITWVALQIELTNFDRKKGEPFVDLFQRSVDFCNRANSEGGSWIRPLSR